MGRDRKPLRSRLLGGDHEVDERLVEALESRLEPTERIPYRLTSGGGIVHERGEERREKGGGEGGVLQAVTDRKLVFVVDTDTGLETADVPYTDLKDVAANGGFLRTELAVTVWGRGTFKSVPRETDAVDDVVAFASAASEVWQRAVAALQDARQHVSTLPGYVADGDMDAAADARAAARDNVRKARERARSAPESVGAALRERIESVEREVARVRSEARHDRARTLSSRARVLADAREYDRAYATLVRARSHVEAALDLASEEGFESTAAIQSERAALGDQLALLEARPLERAERALARAQAVENPELAVVAWEETLDRYRDALAAGWGTEADFDGETDALRMQVEWVVATLVRLRRRLARRHDAAGDECRVAGDRERASSHYGLACDHLDAAVDLASQYRAGDAAALRDYRWWVTGKREAGG